MDEHFEVGTGQLHCDECKKEYSIEEILALCDLKVTFPNKWASFTCSACEEENDVEITENEINVGIIAGTPPAFEVLETAPLGPIKIQTIDEKERQGLLVTLPEERVLFVRTSSILVKATLVSVNAKEIIFDFGFVRKVVGRVSIRRSDRVIRLISEGGDPEELSFFYPMVGHALIQQCATLTADTKEFKFMMST
ncbi:MAG: hypothetical protein B7Y39_16410 [Bdellovibrio sp. 28-41-41]|nr:MAG: hypothetical protein B7Y39_16410 [Bdellovibrio sp. 28-41-41]